jgi:predicted nuclease of restriction endonuclease-like (RecB) superfamily
MKLLLFQSNLPQTHLAPNYKHHILENDISQRVNTYELEAHMLKREKELILLQNTTNTEALRYKFFNEEIFKKPYMINFIDVLREHINFYFEKLMIPTPDRLWLQMWCNILKKDERIEIHQHSYDEKSLLSGNLCLKTENTNTHYINPHNYFAKNNEIYNSKNVRGKLTLFPSIIPHATDVVQTDEVRITIAFDVLVADDIKLVQWKKKRYDLFKENVVEL